MIQHLVDEKETLVKENLLLSQQNSDSLKTIEENKHVLQDKDYSIQQLKEQNSFLNDTIQELTTSMNSLKETIQQKENEYLSLESKYKLLNEESSKTIQIKDNEIVRLTETVDVYDCELNEKDMEIVQVRKQLAVSEHYYYDYNDLLNEYDNIKTELDSTQQELKVCLEIAGDLFRRKKSLWI